MTFWLEAMMTLSLHKDIHHCLVAGQPIFLDGRLGRYCALPDRLEAAFLHFLDAACAKEARIDILMPLIAKGWLVPCETWQVPAPIRPIPPTRDRDEDGARSSALDVMRSIGTQISILASLQHQPFWAIMRRLADDRDKAALRPATAPSDRIERLADALGRTRFLLGVTDRCLARSLALIRLAHAQGITPDLILGVRTHPFTAHCWVQQADLVLNDRVDHVRLFTPILQL